MYATIVPALAVLLAGCGSSVAQLTVAVLVIAPALSGAVTETMIAGAAPTASSGRVHVTVPVVWLQLQPMPEALT